MSLTFLKTVFWKTKFHLILAKVRETKRIKIVSTLILPLSMRIWKRIAPRKLLEKSIVDTNFINVSFRPGNKNNWFWQRGRTCCRYIYLFHVTFILENVILNSISLIFLNRLRISSESDTIYKRSEIVGGAISDGNWKEIWKKYSGTREWPKICRVLGCSNDAAVAAHIGINGNQRYYILPMCNTCSFTGDNVIKVKTKSAAVPIFQRDIKCMLKVNCYP